MRIFSYVAVISTLSAQTDDSVDTLEINYADQPDYGESTVTVEVTDMPATTEGVPPTEVVYVAPTAPPRPTLPPNYKPMFAGNARFRSFAAQNHFPPLVEENRMMASMHQMPQIRNKMAQASGPSFHSQNEKPKLQCMVCNGRSYDDCYHNSHVRECPSQETACFLEVRYNGPVVESVRSDCMQEVACINQMKQNFFDYNEYGQGGVNYLDHGKHDCKLFSGNQFANSVCRNCCFDNNCTEGWQPNSFQAWNIGSQKKVQKQMMLFEQFSHPPNYWDNLKQQQQIQSQQRQIHTQVFTSVDDFNRPPTFADLPTNSNKSIRRNPTNYNTKAPRQNPVQTFRAQQAAEQDSMRAKMLAKQKQQQLLLLKRQEQLREQQQGPGFRPAKVVNAKPASSKKKTTRATETPKTAVPDADFFALMAKLEPKNERAEPKKPVQLKAATTKKPVQQQAVNKVLPKKPTVPKKPSVVKKAPPKKGKTAGAGKWAHLPLWKQRQLQAARQKAYAAAKAKALARAKALKAQKSASSGQKPEPKTAQNQMMKFSSSVEKPTNKATFEDGPVVEVTTQMSDDEFSKMIASIDSKSSKETDFDSLIKSIESERENNTESSDSDSSEKAKPGKTKRRSKTH